jgi:hypothetical protein
MDPLRQYIEQYLLPKSTQTSTQYLPTSAGSGRLDTWKIAENDENAFYHPSSDAIGRQKNTILLTSCKFQWGFLELMDMFLIPALFEFNYRIGYIYQRELKFFTDFDDFYANYAQIETHQLHSAQHFIESCGRSPRDFHILDAQQYERIQYNYFESLPSLQKILMPGRSASLRIHQRVAGTNTAELLPIYDDDGNLLLIPGEDYREKQPIQCTEALNYDFEPFSLSQLFGIEEGSEGLHGQTLDSADAPHESLSALQQTDVLRALAQGSVIHFEDNVQATLSCMGVLIPRHSYRIGVYDGITASDEIDFRINLTNPSEILQLPFTICAEGKIIFNNAPPGTYVLPHLTAHDRFDEIILSPGLQPGAVVLTGACITLHEPQSFIVTYKLYSLALKKLWTTLTLNPVHTPVASAALNECQHKLQRAYRSAGGQITGDLIKDLVSFFGGFRSLTTDEAGHINQLPSSLDRLCKIIEMKAGQCGSRAKSFVLLANSLGYQAKCVTNARHEWVEVACSGPGDALIWYPFDLGGTLAKYIKVSTPSADLLPPQSQRKTFTPIELRGILERSAVPSSQQPCLVLRNPSKAWHLWGAVREQISAENELLYINGVTDIIRYWQTTVIHAGKSIEQPGPLQQPVSTVALQYVVINWTEFTDQECAAYLSLLDPVPRLFGQELKPNIQLVHLWSGADIQVLGKAFISRIKPIYIEDVYGMAPNVPTQVEAAIAISRDLYQLPTWRDQMLGELSFQHRDGALVFTLLPGLLQQASRENRPIVLYNVPNDPQLTRLIEGVNYERRWYFQGQWLTFSAAVYIVTQTREPVFEAGWLKPLVKLPEARNYYYLSRSTFWNFFGNVRIAEKVYTPTPGWFAAWKDTDVLIVTENLSAQEWQALHDEWHSQKHRVPLTYYCLPDVDVPGHSMSAVATMPGCQETYRVHSSNDPEFTACTLYPDAAYIFVSPQDNYPQLLDKIQIQTMPDKNLRAVWWHSQLYERLLASQETIVLIGTLNGHVTRQILPLLAESGPKAMYNAQGQVQPITGQLVWCASRSQMLPVVPNLCINYTIAEYHSYFLKLSQKLDEAASQQITQWFRWVQKLAHSGTAMPNAALQLTYRSWHQLYQHLTNPLAQQIHAQNPLKMLLYDYQHGSEVYCFLNVAAKIHFAKLKDTRREDYFVRSKVHMAPNYSWAKLNAYSGNMLQRELPTLEYLDQQLDWKSCPPKLLKYESVATALAAANADEKLSKQATHLDKPQWLVEWFLQQDQWRIAFLKGEFGLGKTHFIRNIVAKQCLLHETIISWLQEKYVPGGKIPLLLLDECNLQPEGQYDFLFGLATGQVFYQGQFYEISPQHKAIATGNLEYYPDRYYHQLLREAFVIYFKGATKTFFMQLCTEKKIPPTAHDMLWQVYLLGEAWLVPLKQSIRDMDYLISHYHYLLSISGVKAQIDPLELAIDLYYFRELAPNFTRFCDLCEHYLQRTPEPFASVRRAITGIIDRHIKNDRHILLEGEAGAGKSHLLQELTRGNNSLLLQGGQLGNAQQLTAAFHQGKKVLYDELNILPDENLLNSLLTGVDAQGNLAQREGFQLLATQNPSHYRGRKPISTALKSRFINLYMPNLTEDDLRFLGQQHGYSPAKIESILSLWKPQTPFNLRDFFS